MLETIQAGLFGTNCYIYSADGKTALIFDPAAEAEKIIGRLDLLKLSPRCIAFTHGHIDHMLALPGLADYARSLNIEPQIAVSEGDRRYLGAGAVQSHNNLIGVFQLGGLIPALNELIKKLPEPTLILKDGDPLWDTGFTAIHTPGHTVGGMCFYRQAQGILISGDTLFRMGVGRTDFPGGDMPALINSIKNRLFVLPGETKVYPGHGPATTINTEKESNPFL